MNYSHISIEENQPTTRNDTLKLIAMVTMLIDHIGVLFFPGVTLFRTIGRIAFPIFAYQLALGFNFTHDRYQYGRRLLIFAFISQIPYVFLNPTMTLNLGHFNVIFLFAYSLVVLGSYDLTRSMLYSFKLQVNIRLFIFMISSLLATICLIILPISLEILFPTFRFSYSTYGVVMILLFHRYNQRYIKLVGSYAILSIAFAYINGGIYLLRGLESPLLRLRSIIPILLFRFQSIWTNITFWKDGFMMLDGYFFQSRSIISIFIIPVFERFYLPLRLNKYIGYLFYPGHITFLLLLKWLIK